MNDPFCELLARIYVEDIESHCKDKSSFILSYPIIFCTYESYLNSMLLSSCCPSAFFFVTSAPARRASRRNAFP